MKQLNPEKLFAGAERKRAASKFSDAIPLYLEAKALSIRAGGDKEFVLDCLFALGDTYRMVGEFKRAAQSYRKAARRALAMDEGARALDAEVGLALSQRGLSEHREAIRIFNRALKGYAALKDRPGRAFTLWARAGALRLKGDLAGAIKDLKESKRIFSALGDRAGVGYCLTALGGTSRVKGATARSFKYYKEASMLFSALGDTFGLAYSYCGIANAMRMKGDFEGSLGYFAKARSNYKLIGDKVSYAYTLWGEGSALQMLGKNARALKDFKLAEALFKETKDRRGLVYCMISVGTLMVTSGRGAGGRAMLGRALKKADGLGLAVERGYAKTALRAAGKSPEELPLNLA